MAIERLPGQASGSLRITEQRTPCRSTTADHIRFGENKPPFPSEDCTTVASLACKLLTVELGMLQPFPWLFWVWARTGVENNNSPAEVAIKQCLICRVPPCY